LRNKALVTVLLNSALRASELLSLQVSDVQCRTSVLPEVDLIQAITTNTRKAPAFLQGLLQFDLRLVGDGGLEPPTPCL
jgi:hypothetical protein